ncbi:MAG: EAL domain-containing protein [Bacillaceae bacterium]|nr:EAL domain-containing protein [Bacillaceae bacterium]
MSISGIKEKLDNRQFHNVYQPLYDLKKGQVIGFESLFRLNTGHNPEQVFQTAREEGCLYDLDTASAYHSVMDFSKLFHTTGEKLFVNLFPSTLLHSSFSSFINQLVNTVQLNPENMVIEINENEVISNIGELRDCLLFLKKKGFSIAIDDVGKGSASFQNIIEMEPDLIKLDKYFARELIRSKRKQEAIKVFVNFSTADMKVVLEGIETKDDLDIARELGVDIGQGFYLSKPDTLEQFITNSEVLNGQIQRLGKR